MTCIHCTLDIETSALAALARVRNGDTNFRFVLHGEPVLNRDIATLEMIAAWQQPYVETLGWEA